MLRPVTCSRRSSTSRYLQASETRMLRTSSPVEAGVRCPARTHAAAMRPGMSPGRRRSSSSGSKSGTSSLAASARRSRSSYPAGPAGSSERRLSCSSHSPITLRSRRVVPSMPRSLERLKPWASSSSAGSSTSRPSSDQVPLESTAELRSRRGAATNADAVSWAATAHTGTSPSSWWGSSAPATVPGSMISPKMRDGSPSCSIRSPSARCGHRAAPSWRPPWPRSRPRR